MSIQYQLNTLINSLKSQKKYAIFSYSKLTYAVFLLFKQFYIITSIYKLKGWILVYLSNNIKYFNIKMFNIKNKKNMLSYKKLKKIKNKYGIIFTSKGICSLTEALKLHQGGILFCLIYYSN